MTGYYLQPPEVALLAQTLKPAEFKVLLYLRTIDPTGTQPQSFQVTELADLLGMHKSSVSRALYRLASLKFIDLEIHSATIRSFSSEELLHTRNPVASAQHSLDERMLRQRNTVAATQQSCTEATPLHPRNDIDLPQRLGIADFSGIARPQQHTDRDQTTERDLKNSSVLKKDLSKRRKKVDLTVIDDSFREWLTDRARRLPKPPVFLEQWISAQAQKESVRAEYERDRLNPEPGSTLAPPIASPDFMKTQFCGLLLSAYNKGDKLGMSMIWQDIRQNYPALGEEIANEHPTWCE